MAKPVVDGLEHKLEGKVRFIKVNIGDDDGTRVAARFGVSGVPTFILLDGEGRVVYRKTGGSPTPPRSRSASPS
jgi:thioredoxin-like negative regulator of GroEL